MHVVTSPALTVKPLVDECHQTLLDSLLTAPCPDVLTPFFEHGKMRRAELALLAAGAISGRPRDGMAGAVAIELLHGASLVHDDIIDEGAERRGQPAVHRQTGRSVAIAIGDYLVLQAFAELAGAIMSRPAERVVRAMGVLASWGQECCRGEVLELRPARPMASPESYTEVARGKTGSLFAAAASVGALLAGATRAEVDALSAAGLAIGAAYQIDDDLIDGPGLPADLLLRLHATNLDAANRSVAALRASRYADALFDFIRRETSAAASRDRDAPRWQAVP